MLRNVAKSSSFVQLAILFNIMSFIFRAGSRMDSKLIGRRKALVAKVIAFLISLQVYWHRRSPVARYILWCLNLAICVRLLIQSQSLVLVKFKLQVKAVRRSPDSHSTHIHSSASSALIYNQPILTLFVNFSFLVSSVGRYRGKVSYFFRLKLCR
jgi:hypothetical protein